MTARILRIELRRSVALWTALLIAPLLVVAGFIGFAVLPPLFRDREQGDPGVILLFPYLRGPRDGEYAVRMLSAQANLTQALWLAAVAATGLALFAAARRGTRVAALLPALIGAAVAVPAAPARFAAAWVEDDRATEVVCTRDEPAVCVSRVESHLLARLRGPARQALSTLAAKLPPGAARAEVRVVSAGIPQAPQPADTIQLFVSHFDDLTEETADNLLGRMLAGAGVRPCVNQLGFDPTRFIEGPPPEPNHRYLAARQAAYGWLVGGRPPQTLDDGDPAAAFTGEALAALYALPADEQRARVAALRAAELTCARGDRLDLLTGGTR
ncbi:hypothetical protein GCM10009555_003650 [Acrocarpospora macrocephala]|uniref:Uncharacterized protein n=1 Tax=Acrocarpospora macrocephala TaxID=150177 RepID=A0A5M3X513_9ACTN|nr:hypothetical protein [Acrocarpospora macrocephala]GES16244.1 hypothetical protein Amac_098420 [Acrocarpospora macrocephala]